MMRFGPAQQPGRGRREPIIPMINVVFLLLIFFLLSASITPPEALEVDPPNAQADTPEDITAPLLIAADGRLAYADAQGDGIWPLLARRDAQNELPIRADGALPATELAAILSQVAVTTDAAVALVVQPREGQP
ncbi:ExbD/TolR family protein [Paracoccus tegillarcae]|uniref:Biopolymer transporter ExbD n=1 Tax=Paracoccus tegillarcae TaxID=1529068 RepID=A0A2K9EUA8_9RHOB|nr:biopolymer transporter ExbD [Paracoccus tegillarcae]AUH32814.1 biopolymer transporter ExbD [Paracoccus tegillarcae]